MDHPDHVPLLDPSTPFRQVPTSTDLRSQLHLQRNDAAAELAVMHRPPQDTLLRRLYTSQIGLAVLSFFGTAVLLYLVNPPVTQVRRRDNRTAEKQDWRWVFLLSLLVAVLVYIMPDLLAFLHIYP